MEKPRERPLPDEASADSFPASDPPARSGITGVGGHGDAGKPTEKQKLKPSPERGHDERPTGQPTWERHAQETAHVTETDKTTTKR